MIAERTHPHAPVQSAAPLPTSNVLIAEVRPPRPGVFATVLTRVRRAGRAFFTRFDRRDDDYAALIGSSDAEIERIARRPRPTPEETRWEMAMHHHGDFRRW